MKIIIIGAGGTIGKHVTTAFAKDHEIIKVGSGKGDILADMTSPESIKSMFETIGSFDALISTAGKGHFGPLKTMSDADFRKGLHYKLLGQVNLVLIGQHYINPRGSFTLTSGILNNEPVAMGANLSAVCGAIDGFVRSAALELENDVRINVVSPNVVEESPALFPFFPGQRPVAMDRVTAAYIRSVLGAGTGQVFTVNSI
jgi:NAD(P)-dependent dehydrogenase (short-subunit alcohol dehydrogenase family)